MAPFGNFFHYSEKAPGEFSITLSVFGKYPSKTHGASNAENQPVDGAIFRNSEIFRVIRKNIY